MASSVIAHLHVFIMTEALETMSPGEYLAREILRVKKEAKILRTDGKKCTTIKINITETYKYVSSAILCCYQRLFHSESFPYSDKKL